MKLPLKRLVLVALAAECLIFAQMPAASASDAWERYKGWSRQRQDERTDRYREELAEKRTREREQHLQTLRESVAKGTAIGILPGPVPERVRNNFGVPPHIQGAIVTEVIPQSSAEKAGILKGDIIFRIGNTTLQGGGDEYKREMEAATKSRSGQFRVTVYNVNTRATRELTVELPSGMRVSPDDLDGNQVAALYAVAIPQFVTENCPHLMPNWGRISAILQKTGVPAAIIKEHVKYKEQVEQWKAVVAKGGANELCEDMIRTTYTSSFGSQMLSGIINRR